MNVRINLSGLKDEKLKATLQEKMERLAPNRKRVPERPRDGGKQIVVTRVEGSVAQCFANFTGSLDSAQDDGRLSA